MRLPEHPAMRLAAVTTSRADFGRLLPLYRRLTDDPRFALDLAVAGSHLGPAGSASEVVDSGIPIARRIEPPLGARPWEVGGCLVYRLTEWLLDRQPDYLLLLGDRHEILGCAMAALYAGVPVIHIGGGHVTRGAIDEQIRHAVSKLAAWHLVASEAGARRVAALGEPANRIRIVGAPDLDMVRLARRIPRQPLLAELGLDPGHPFLLVTIHPETLAPPPDTALDEVFAALAREPRQLLVTGPCADPGEAAIRERIAWLMASRTGVAFRDSLGEVRYLSALHEAAAVVGNSSSGIIEASLTTVPAIDIGRRQEGRERTARVLHADWSSASLTAALARVDDLAATPLPLASPYGDGHAAEAIVRFLEELAGATSWLDRVA